MLRARISQVFKVQIQILPKSCHHHDRQAAL